MKLTQPMKDMLNALITLHKTGKGESVRSEEIARYLNRKPGTVRRLMPILCTMGLVKSTTGRRGGYRPTSRAYEVLSVTEPQSALEVPVKVNGKAVNASAERLILRLAGNSGFIQAKVRFVGDTRILHPGCYLTIGPAPSSGMVVAGRVIGKDDTDNSAVVEVMEFTCLPDRRVEECMSPVTYLHAAERVDEAARRIAACGCALVRSGIRLLGFLTSRHIARAVAEGKPECRVEEVVERRIVVIDRKASIMDSFRIMAREGIELLVVRGDGELVGVVREVDVLKALNAGINGTPERGRNCLLSGGSGSDDSYLTAEGFP